MSKESRTLGRIAGFMDVIECPEQDQVCKRVAIVCRALLSACELLKIEESVLLEEESKKFQERIESHVWEDFKAPSIDLLVKKSGIRKEKAELYDILEQTLDTYQAVELWKRKSKGKTNIYIHHVRIGDAMIDYKLLAKKPNLKKALREVPCE